ncbi:hypothetical protein, partial [Burkholderia ubonensis]|uniref:hypothetical protein n=1 Tax=Burkholderia ubonensis TaxID=101571 RepID=UPI001E4E00CC
TSSFNCLSVFIACSPVSRGARIRRIETNFARMRLRFADSGQRTRRAACRAAPTRRLTEVKRPPGARPIVRASLREMPRARLPALRRLR